MPLHARTVWCPLCTPPQKLIVKKHDDRIHITKGCKKCKRKFTYIRTDTPQGRAARTKKWRVDNKPAEPTSDGIVIDEMEEYKDV